MRSGAAGQILSWARGMPLLNWLATELVSVLLMVEHRADHTALWVRFPRKTLAVLASPSDGAKAPRPGTPERWRKALKPCGARHSAKRRRLAHRVRGKELRAAIDGRKGEGVASATREAPAGPRDRCTTGLGRRSVRRLPFRGPGSNDRLNERNE